MQIDTLRTIVQVPNANPPSEPLDWMRAHIGHFVRELMTKYEEIGIEKLEQMTLQVEFRWTGIKKQGEA